MSKSAAYLHVAGALRDRVLTGTYAPGTKMPSLREVEDEFAVSRATSRTAYQVLIGEGAIWDTDPGTAGRSLVVDGVRVSTETPPGDVANDLRLEADARTVVRRRRYVLDDKPVLLSTSYFPADIASGTPIEQEDTGPGGAYARLVLQR